MRRPQTMKAVVIGIGICCSVSCAGPVEEMTVDLQRVRAKCGAPDASDFFFPAGMFRQRDDATKALRREYSAMLSSTGQPSLSCGNSPQMGYRVIRIPHMPRNRSLYESPAQASRPTLSSMTRQARWQAVRQGPAPVMPNVRAKPIGGS